MTPSNSPSSSPNTPRLCVSVTRLAGSVHLGGTAPFTVKVWTDNWTPAGEVTITLSAQPPALAAGFHAKPNRRATSTCTIAAPGTKPAALDAQIPVKASVRFPVKASVRAVTLKALARLSTSGNPTAAAAEAVPVSASTPAGHSSPARLQTSAGYSKGLSSLPALPLGPLPTLGTTIGAGNAAGLFPTISPSPDPAPAPGTHGSQGNQHTTQVALVPQGKQSLTAQVIGLIALAFALLLALTRLTVRRRQR